MNPYQNAIPHEDIKHRETLQQLLHDNAYRHGKFTLSSGQESEHYVNCKPVTLSCEGNALLSKLMIKYIDKKAVAVGGLTLGADPLVCGVAQRSYYIASHTDLDALIIRKNPKGYGTKEVIEGPNPNNLVLNIKQGNVTTTGSSAMTAVRVLRDAGYVVNRVVAIVDRMENHQTWIDNDIEFFSLFLLNDIT